MATRQINRVSAFTIGKDEVTDWAIYTHRRDFDVKSAAHAEQIMEAVRTGKERLDALDGPRDEGRPERNLDIADTGYGGVCRYQFLLNAEFEGKQRLKFVRYPRPFIALSLNSDSGERFLTDFKVVDREGLMASFVCDLGKVRRSELAKWIRKLNKGAAGHGHPDILNIPFAFNVVDPEFKASPWVVPGHPVRDRRHDHDHPHTHGGADFDRRTHGGVHPTTSAFLSVDITER